MVYGMALWAWHGIWHGMVSDMAWQGLAWYLIWPAGHCMVCGMALRDMEWYMISPGGHGIVYGVLFEHGFYLTILETGLGLFA